MDLMNRDEVFFISYEDVIKSPSIAILKTILLKYADCYKDFIDFKRINALNNLDTFYSFFLLRQHKNVLEELAIKKFNYEKSAMDVYNATDDILKQTKNLRFSLSIEILLLQRFTTNIFIWSEKYDEKIRLDLLELFGRNEKINYIVGNIADCVNKVGVITCFVLNDVYLLPPLMQTSSINNSLVLLANYMYNYKEDENKSRLKVDNLDMHVKENEFKFMLFNPIQK